MADNILSTSQINTIKKAIAKVFIEEQDGNLKIDLLQFNQQANQIIKMAKYQKGMLSKNFEILNLTSKKQALLAKGYILIMEFRHYLFEEEINYRYYIKSKGDAPSYEKAVEFSENDISKYMKFNKDKIVFNELKLKESKINEAYSNFASYYSNLYMAPDVNDYMRLIKSTKLPGRIVRSNIMNQYYSQNPKLKNAKTNRYQVFTRGHIMEAIDISTSQVLQTLDSNAAINEDTASITSLMTQYMFGKNLNYDNVAASAGADNNITKTSIKATGADLYDYYTIVSQLSSIIDIINNGFNSEEERMNTFQKMFMDKSKYISEEDFQNVAQKAYDKLLDDIDSQLKQTKINIQI